MSAVIGALRAELSASIAQFQSDLGKAADSVKGFSKQCESIAGGLEKIGTRMSLAITAPLVLLGAESVKAAKEVTQSLAQVESALASTGGRSGKTAADLQKTAKQLETLSTFDDDDILKDVSANLLRFENISGPIFDRAQQAAVNLAARLGIDLSAAASTVGKALDQPITGLQALSRLGVRFTEDQKKQVTALVASGKGFEAQGVILKALEERFNGAAAAARAASPDAALLQQWRDLHEAIGAIIINDAKPLLDFLERILKDFNDLSPAMQGNIVKWGAIAAVAGPVIVAFSSVISIVGKLAPIIAAAGEVIASFFGGEAMAGIIAALAGLGAVFAVIGAAIVAFVALVYPFRDTIITAFQDIYDFGKSVLGDGFSNLLAVLAEAWSKLVDILVGLWNGPLGDFLKVLGQGLASLAAAFVYAFGGTVIILIDAFVDVVAAAAIGLVDSLDAVVKFLSGDFVGAWKAAKKVVTDVGDALTESHAKSKQPKPATIDATGQVESVTVTGTRQKPQKFKPNFDLGPGATKAADQLQKLEEAAAKDSIAVRRFALGDLPPLDKALEDVDTKYETLRSTINGHIADLKKLTIQNAATRDTIKQLQGQLVLLDAAHEKARAGAVAQYQAEKEISDLQNQSKINSLQRTTRDFSQSMSTSPMTDAQKALQKNADDLSQTQNSALTDLKTSQAQLAKAQQDDDQDQVDRLKKLIPVQQQYYDLVSNTTAQQMTAAQQIQKAWQGVADGISDSLLDVLTTFQFNTKGVVNVLSSVIRDLLKPVTDSAGSAIAGLAKSAFSGFFATGGFIPPGQWGIAGENGMEPVFGGKRGATVIPAADGNAPGTIYIDARGAVETVPAQIQAAIRAAAPGLISTAVTQAGRNVPSQMVSAQKRKL